MFSVINSMVCMWNKNMLDKGLFTPRWAGGGGGGGVGGGIPSSTTSFVLESSLRVS